MIMKKKINFLLRLSLFVVVAAGCQNSAAISESSVSSTASSAISEISSHSSAASSFAQTEGKSKRVSITLDEAVLKKNRDEQFIVLYVKDDCEYCAEFDEVLDPYLEEHPLTIYEISLTEAEAMYSDEDRQTMLDILTGGVGRTPALYYIESQETVNLLDHTQDNYSEDGLNQWVEKHDLERLK